MAEVDRPPEPLMKIRNRGRPWKSCHRKTRTLRKVLVLAFLFGISPAHSEAVMVLLIMRARECDVPAIIEDHRNQSVLIFLPFTSNENLCNKLVLAWTF